MRVLAAICSQGKDEEDDFSIWKGSSVFFLSGQFYCFLSYYRMKMPVSLTPWPWPNFIDTINLEMLKCLFSAMPGVHMLPFKTNIQVFLFQEILCLSLIKCPASSLCFSSAIHIIHEPSF